MKSLSRRRIVLSICVVALLAIFVPPSISLKRFSDSIAGAISKAVGRPATVGKVHLRLFPEPGFDLENLVISDDPSLSAEPMLRADEVTATLRLSSLWRGRLEIGKLSLKYPSLNLVRGADGRWNIESLLEQARRIPAAPTAKTRPESRPRFPYIAAEGGRINFKLGLEKKIYALTEADFGLWLAAENEWHVRLAARPMRTDANLSDTGTFKLSGSFERAWNLRQTPLQLRVEVQRAQLGQLSALLYGRDRGWRGALSASATLSGTPAALNVTADASVDDFRRYDILSDEHLRLQAHCDAAYSTATELLSPLLCNFPFEGGTVTLRGAATGLLQTSSYDLTVTAEDLPTQAIVILARHVKKDVALDLSASGTVDAAFTLRRAGAAQHIWTGAGAASDVQLRSRTLGQPLVVRQIGFRLEGPGTDQLAPADQSKLRGPQPASQHTVVSITPFAVPLGGGTPTHAQGWFSASGYSLRVQGDSSVERVIQVARGLGLGAPQVTATGTAKLDLTIAGDWSGFPSPVATGTVQLRGITVPLQGVAVPLEISSAELALTEHDSTLQKMLGTFSGVRTALSGWVRLPRSCDTLEQCPAQFSLQADQLALDEVNSLLNPRAQRRPWYNLLGRSDSGSLFTRVQASGRITAARAITKMTTATHVAADVRIDGRRVSLSNFRGQVFGGTLSGEWQADFTGKVPLYEAQGRLERASMAQIASSMRDDWATGTVDLMYEGTTSGWDADGLAGSAAGTVQFDWRDGTLPHVTLGAADPPLHIRRFAGRMSLRSGLLNIVASKMETPSGIYKVSGTASLERQLGVRLLGDGKQAFVITGTLDKPQVAPASTSETRASLR